MGERNKVIAIVGVPLLVLLGVVSVLDFFRLREGAIERHVGRLAERAGRAARTIEGRAGAVRESVHVVRGVLEATGSIDDAEVYSLIGKQLERDVWLRAMGVVFPPGSRPPGAMGPEIEPRIPLLQREADREASRLEAMRTDWFGPCVVRTPEGLARLDLSGESAGLALLNLVVGAGNGESWKSGAELRIWINGGRWTLVSAGRGTGAVVAEVGEAMATLPADDGVGVFTVNAELVSARESGVGVRAADLKKVCAGIGRGEKWEKEVEGEDGVVLVRGARVESLGVVCVATVARAEVMREVYRELRQRLLAGSIVVLVLVAVAGTVGPAVLKPIRKLTSPPGGGRLDLGGTDREGGGASTLAKVRADLRDDGSGTSPARGGGGVGAGRSQDDTIARSIQASLLSMRFPVRAEFELFGMAVPALRVGGDFYDFFAVGKETVAVAIADVAGKGVGAAMFMSATRTLVREIALAEGHAAQSPGEVLTRANHLLLDANPELLFVTAFLGFYNVRTGVLVWSSAGHPAPLVVRGGGGGRGHRVEALGRATGTVMGAFDGLKYDDREAMLQPGDRLVMFTDGVSEATAPGGAMFGMEGLTALCLQFEGLKCEAFCQEVMGAVDAFQQGKPHDDATVLAMRRLK